MKLKDFTEIINEQIEIFSDEPIFYIEIIGKNRKSKIIPLAKLNYKKLYKKVKKGNYELISALNEEKESLTILF